MEVFYEHFFDLCDLNFCNWDVWDQVFILGYMGCIYLSVEQIYQCSLDVELDVDFECCEQLCLDVFKWECCNVAFIDVMFSVLKLVIVLHVVFEY